MEYLNLLKSKSIQSYFLCIDHPYTDYEILETILASSIYADEVVGRLKEFIPIRTILDDKLVDKVKKYISDYEEYVDKYYTNPKYPAGSIFIVYEGNSVYCPYNTFKDALEGLDDLIQESTEYKFRIECWNDIDWHTLTFIVDDSNKLHIEYDKFILPRNYIPSPFYPGCRVKPFTDDDVSNNYHLFGVNFAEYDSNYDYYFISNQFSQKDYLAEDCFSHDIPLIHIDARDGSINEHIHGVKAWMLESEEMDQRYTLSGDKLNLIHDIALDIQSMITDREKISIASFVARLHHLDKIIR